MFEIDSPAPVDNERLPHAPLRRGGDKRRAAPQVAPSAHTIKPLPRWARFDPPATDPKAGGFFAAANLALFDQILRPNDGVERPFSGVLRQRLALRAAAACVRLARLREDEGALRDAEHLAVGSASEATSPGGQLHRLWRLFAARPAKWSAATLRSAQALLGWPGDESAQDLADALDEIVAKAPHPLAAAAGASLVASRRFEASEPKDAEVFSLWLADGALAQKLGWVCAIPLIASAIAHPVLRQGQHGRRPRPGDPDWADALAGAYALGAQDAFDIAVDLSRRAQRLSNVAPKLRAKGASRVIELLLADDCVSPARAAKHARLSDRAARRLFDRLVELDAVRELSGRPSFRLYGL